LFGAFCPAKDLGVALVLPYVNTEGMALHLKEVSKEIPQENHAVMFVDGAAWHRTKKLDMPENITIVILPAYSPEENPAEKVWQYLKDNFLSGRIFDCYEEIVEATCDVWNKLTAEAGRISSLTSFKQYQII
jgi:transposase